MAELRIINKEYNIENFSIILNSLISLPKDYEIIPYPLKELGLRITDSVILIIGPSGVFLISSQLLSKYSEHELQISEYESARYLKEYAEELVDLFGEKHIKFSVPIHLFMLTNEEEKVYSELDIRLIPFSQIRSAILQLQNETTFTALQKEQIIYALKANNLLPKINKYQILKELSQKEGQNNFIAYDLIADRQVFIKEIKKDPGINDISILMKINVEQEEILREAKLTTQLKHDNISNVIEIIQKDENIFIVMEWVEGVQTLRSYIDKTKQAITLSNILSIILQTCDGLACAHSKDVVHRNIRPEHIMLTPEMGVKITNFSLAKQSDMSTRPTFDLKKMIKQNPYAAPEFIVGLHEVDRRADIYSVGVILYEMLTGQVPTHLRESYLVPPSNLCDEIGNLFDDIITKALKFDPNERYSTIVAFRNRLANFDKPHDPDDSLYRYVNRTLYKKTRSSILYKAYDNKLSRPVVLKKVIMEPSLTSNERNSKLDSLFKEACLVSQLTHPYIVSVYDYFLEDDDGYIVMEFVEGQNLREYLKDNGTFSLNTICNISRQIAEALKYAHHQGVVHRDIKPENIIYKDGRIIILDFGIASLTDQKKLAKVAGTALYMAPEQLSVNTEPDSRSDIFSLGVMMYELLTNKYPYSIEMILSNYMEGIVQSPAGPHEINIEISSNLSNLVLKAVAVNVGDRYQKTEDFLTDLNNIYAGNGSDDTDIEHEIESHGTSWMQIILEIITALGLVGVIIFLGTHFLSPVKNNISDILDKKQNSLVSTNYRWITHPVMVTGIMMNISNMTVTNDKTYIKLIIINQTDNGVKFLNMNENPDIVSIVDDVGNNYTSYIDIASISNELFNIGPQIKAEGQICINRALDPGASMLVFNFVEIEGQKRQFSLQVNKQRM